LRPSFSPYKKINQVPPKEVQQALCCIFERRNKPGSFRVDNGEPFGSPSNDTPPPLSLWLICHDIDVIWNKPRCPQMNGVVEHLQDTSSRWAEIHGCRSCEELQRRLDGEAHIQRCIFPVSRLGNKTRAEAFPGAEKSGREWAPSGFCPQRAYGFIAKKVFTRKVSSNGQVNHFGQCVSSLWKWRGKFVQVKLDAKTLEWEVSHNYEVVKKYSSLPHLSEERLLNLSVFQ
jgi:hypothetical protein